MKYKLYVSLYPRYCILRSSCLRRCFQRCPLSVLLQVKVDKRRRLQATQANFVRKLTKGEEGQALLEKLKDHIPAQ